MTITPVTAIYTHVGLARAVHVHCISGDFPANTCICTLYIYMVLANPTHMVTSRRETSVHTYTHTHIHAHTHLLIRGSTRCLER